MIRSIEEMSLNAWPALQTMVYDGWSIRFSNGYTKRANSVNPIGESLEDNVHHKISYCENRFYERGLRPAFKMTEAARPGDLDRILAGNGYMEIDRTSVQVLPLSATREPSVNAVRRDEELTDDWLNGFCALNMQQERHKRTMQQMLALIVPKTCFVSLCEKKTVVSCGLGVVDRGFVGIFDIVTHEDYRNRGFGEQLMLHLLQWGHANGAAHAYLQVMQNNMPALRLYAKLGFREVYQYWYRVKA